MEFHELRPLAVQMVFISISMQLLIQKRLSLVIPHQPHLGDSLCPCIWSMHIANWTLVITVYQIFLFKFPSVYPLLTLVIKKRSSESFNISGLIVLHSVLAEWFSFHVCTSSATLIQTFIIYSTPDLSCHYFHHYFLHT